MHATLTETLYANIVMDKYPAANQLHDMENPAASRFGVARFGVDRFTAEGPTDHKESLEANLKGKAVYINFYQTGADRYFQLIDSILTCSLKEGRFT